MPLSQTQILARQRFLAAVQDGALVYEIVPACLLCGDTRQPVITQKDAYGLPCTMTCCPGCGLIYAVRRLNAESLGRFYSVYYRDLYEADVQADSLGERFADERTRMAKPAAQIVSTLNLSAAIDIVAEIGAGGGWNLIPFTDMGFRTIGFDYDPRLLDLGRSHGIEMHNLGEVVASAQLCGEASLLLAHEVLEHVMDPFSFLADLNAILKPGGYLYLTVPPLNDIPFGYAAGDPLQEFQMAHLTLFDEKTLEAFLAMAGFRIVSPRPDLRLIAQRVGKPQRRSISIPGNYRRNMRRLNFADRIGRHIWSTLFNLYGRNYRSYMRITKLVAAMCSARRRNALLERKTRTGV